MQSVVRYAVCVVFSPSRKDTTRTVMLIEGKESIKPFFCVHTRSLFASTSLH